LSEILCCRRFLSTTFKELGGVGFFMLLAQIYINELVGCGALSDREAIEIVGELRGPCISLLDLRSGLILLPQSS
jgi:hypothetical protein